MKYVHSCMQIYSDELIVEDTLIFNMRNRILTFVLQFRFDHGNLMEVWGPQ